ncbi:MAG: hypothetical protein ACU0BN_14050 [Sulfitobacter sp.]|uniref:hypothetical protein n=1 Tax=Sulfitobacter sp. TaxID=1903071 RepID=UPI0040589B84
MLIIDSRSQLADDAALADWPAPRVIYRAHMQPETDQDDDTVYFIDTSVPVSILDTLRQIILTGRRYSAARPQGALLFTMRGDADDLLRDVIRDGGAGGRKVIYSLDDNGELETLFCAQSVVENPSFFTFFQNMVPGMPKENTKPSLELLDQYLGPEHV